MKHVTRFALIMALAFALPYVLYADCPGKCSGNCMSEKAGAFVKSVPENMLYLISVEDVAMALEQGEDMVVLDVRPSDHYSKGHIEGSLNVPLPKLVDHIEKVPKGKKLAVVCTMDTNSAFAVAILQMHGYDAWILQGGVPGWEEAGQSLVK